MSLLLEALQKAEKAKEEARRRAETGEPAAGGGLTLEPRESAVTGDRHVVTRPELPDISQPMDIVSDDFAPPGSAARRATDPAASSIELAPEPAQRRPPPTERAARTAPQEAGRAAAKNLFEAKFEEPNPKLPFYITMGILAAFAVGTVIYFWIQLRPPQALVNTNPTRPASEKPVEPAMLAKPAAPAAETQAAAPIAPIPGLPAGVPQAAARVEAPTPKPAPVTAPVTAAPAKPAPRATDAPRPRERAPVTASRAAPKVHPRLEQGYAAYNNGDYAAARAAYLDTLRDEPGNRDALLGMAAVEMRAGRYEAADGHYRRLLRADPRDADAHAGVLALRSDQADPVLAESRLKNLLAADPDAHVLNFTLGNQYAQQGRWAEAQHSFFKAFSADSEHPDYAYNLAVSLDQLRQPKLALDYYRRALALAQTRAASFDQALARNRVQTLSQAAR